MDSESTDVQIPAHARVHTKHRQRKRERGRV
jgi:hypothetical protein